MFWLEVLTLAVLVGLSLWTSGWLKRHPELTLRQVLGRLAVGVLALVAGVVALWTRVPGLREDQEGGLVGGGSFLLISLLREVPAVRALPTSRRWSLYTLAAWSIPVMVTLALGVLTPDAPGEAMLDFLLPSSLVLLILTPAALLIAWLWHRCGRGRGLILPGPDERSPDR
ncbi:hypothetical protein [Deinococcus sp. NW-56]|uniref:hypothetical protein n=1 Tax=Deinococcus sp. NW-56 TaxID=2080419 RepID=UPI000CF4864E|nr:hypothetical protein [Deinococcus sp. NW-56]